MPDISMCLDNTCPSRTLCRRHEASGTRPNEHWQAYGGTHCPRGLTHCPAYWATSAVPASLPLVAPAPRVLELGSEEAEWEGGDR